MDNSNSLTRSENIKIILVTHNLDVAQTAHQEIYLRDGRVEKEEKD